MDKILEQSDFLTLAESMALRKNERTVKYMETFQNLLSNPHAAIHNRRILEISMDREIDFDKIKPNPDMFELKTVCEKVNRDGNVTLILGKRGSGKTALGFKLVEENNNDVWSYCELWEKEVNDVKDVCLEKEKLIISVKKYDNKSFDVMNENLKDPCDIEIVAQNRNKDWYSLKVLTLWDDLSQKYFSIEKKLLNAWLAVN